MSRFATRLPAGGLLMSCLVVGLCLSGCLASQRRDNDLETTLRKYESTLRWGHLQNAYYFGRADPGQSPKIPDGLDNMRVTHYEVVRPVTRPDQDTATQLVEIQYLRRDEQVVRRVMDSQRWQYDPQDGRWYLSSPVVQFQ
jgi:hypothetical protein